jgi:Mg-chelatase subunit ChlD
LTGLLSVLGRPAERRKRRLRERVGGMLRFLPWARRRPPVVALAAPLQPHEPETLFPRLADLYRASRNAFQRWLHKVRRAEVDRAGGRRKAGVVNSRVGRNAKPVPYRPGENLIAPLLTALNAARAGRVAGSGGALRRVDLMGWDKLERQSLTLVLVVDTSRSSHYYINVFRQILRSLAGQFQRKRDRIGLISLQGLAAQVLNHPTHNYRVVMNSMAKLAIHGESPLADGLLKALAMVKLERFRNPGSRSLVLLLSDCYPEPLTRQHQDLFEEPAYKNAVAAALLYRKENVNLLVINPACSGGGRLRERKGPGEKLSEILARSARGRLIKFNRWGASGRVSAHGLSAVLDGIEEAFHAGGGRGIRRNAPGEVPGLVLE